jgi:rare lipoprotein A
MRVRDWILLSLLLTACSTHTTRVIETPGTRELKGWQKTYEVDGQRYQPLRDHQGFSQEGIASWYGKKFHGRPTSNGEIYDMYAMTAAHKTLPLGVEVRVTNRRNGKSTVVRVNDRGPFVAGRIIDLSYSAAKQLDVVEQGTAPVEIVALGYPQHQGGKLTYAAPLDYDAGSFAVQVGAFSQGDNAKRLARNLKPRYGRAEVHFSEADGRGLYRVRVGDFHSLQLAESAKEELRNNGFSGAFVVAFD